MANRRIATMDIVELVRLLRAGSSDRLITKMLGHNRRTVTRYRAWAEAQGFLRGEQPAPAEVQRVLTTTLPSAVPPQQTSSVACYAAEICAYRQRGMEVAAIRARLEEAHQHPVSYSALWRLVRSLEPKPKPPEVFVRVEVAAGSEAQVDFGYAGLTLDPATGKPRKTWVFVMVLSYSRHLYAELVFDQRVETWLLCHAHAFAAFGGVPERVVLDNLKAAIVRASLHEPTVQRAYRECAQHYDFLIDPNPPRTPHLKGKVEQGGVHYVTRNFLAGRQPEAIDVLNRGLRHWAEAIAGQRVHGTTKQRPWAQFTQVERAALRPLPTEPYDLATWKQVQIHRDCHIVFEQAFYSAPYRLVGQTLWVRGGARTVQLYTSDHALVATHDRARQPGERQTVLAHLPPEKVPGLVLTREDCQRQAAAIGPQTAAVVQTLLAHRPVDRLRSAGRIVRLRQTYGAERVERACARARQFGEGDYPTIKRILGAGLEEEGPAVPSGSGPALEQPTVPPAALVAPRPLTFVRQASDFVASLWGGAR